MVNQSTKFEVSMFTRYEAMNGSAQCKKLGGLGRLGAVVKVRGARGLSPPASTLAPLLESEPSLPTAGPKLLNSTKNRNVRYRINKF